MCAMKTPGVYIVEKNAFPNSVVEVATAVPAFIGYTEKAINGTNSLTSVPWKINSLSEYEFYFGVGPKSVFEFSFTPENNKSFIAVDSNIVYESVIEDAATADLTAAMAVWINAEAALGKAKDDNKDELTSVNQKAAAVAAAAAAGYLETVDNLVQALSIAEIKKDDYGVITTPVSTVQKGIDKINAKDATYIVSNLKADTDALTTALKAYTIPENAVKYYNVSRSDKFSLYNNLKFFYANGGGSCYIVSVGDYSKDLDRDVLVRAIDTLLKEQEPTMVIVPEAVNLKQQECYDLQNAVANHCGIMKNRITIMDVYDGYKDRQDPSGNIINSFREKTTTPFLNYAAAYYPWLNTSIVSEKEISFLNIDKDDIDDFKTVLKLNAGSPLGSYIDKISSNLETVDLDTVHKVLYNQSNLYSSIIKEMLRQLNLMPTASAMAGVYSLVDHTKEVWKAPANVGLANVISPAVNISQIEQDDLNVPLDGKAINAIRYFVGQGVKVWGARTLDGNSLDWRYINVRRTMIMLEESIGIATKAFVFEPNTANTWVSVRSMIANFLNGIWKRGGLAGAVPEDAFSVHIGLGDTMTPEDILEGIMRITVLVAIVRPAEFIEITFQQQMQKS